MRQHLLRISTVQWHTNTKDKFSNQLVVKLFVPKIMQLHANLLKLWTKHCKPFFPYDEMAL